jgi:CDP-paratose 2-epimerase
MRYLIFGGAGFIGSNYSEFLLKENYEITIIDNLSRLTSRKNIEYLTSKYSNLNFIYGDIRSDFQTIRDYVERSDVVINLAAQVAVTTSLKDPRTDFDINILGTFNILESIRMFNPNVKFIFASTNKVYGDLGLLKKVETDQSYHFDPHIKGISEAQPLELYSPYGCSKGAADQYVLDYSRSYGLNTTVVRQSCIYGKMQYGIEDQGWVAWFTIASMQNKPLTIYGNGKQVRDILYCDDLINLYQRIIENSDISKGQAYNAGGGVENSISLLELIDVLKIKLKKPISYKFDKTRIGDQPIFISDNSKAQAELNWKPNKNISQGLDSMIEWLTENI